MYIKVINPKIHGKTTFGNTGSCARLVDYLGKENEKIQLSIRELFFNADRNYISSNEVIHSIDNNRKGIANGRSRFHSLVIAPDADELKHIDYDPIKLKEYTKKVMEVYAENFNLEKGKKITQNDLVWFAKLEYERNGEYNDGNNMHIHIIVSARDKEQKMSISPNTNSKKRFNRVNFALNSEKAFDKQFSYERKESLLLTHQMRQSSDLDLKANYFTELNKEKQTNDYIQQSQPEHIIPLNHYVPRYSTDKSEEEIKKKRKKRKRRDDQDLNLSR